MRGINLKEIILEVLEEKMDEDMVRDAIEYAIDEDMIRDKICDSVGSWIEEEVGRAIDDMLCEM